MAEIIFERDTEQGIVRERAVVQVGNLILTTTELRAIGEIVAKAYGWRVIDVRA